MSDFLRRNPQFALALLAILAYLPTLRQPLLEDDYPLIVQAHTLGIHILVNPNFSLRATGLLLLDGIYRAFGIASAPYYCLLIAVHVMNTWLVYGLGYWKRLGYATTVWAAAFFAVCEVHQEAVMWVSAVNDSLLFLFGVGSLLCWLRFVCARRWTWYTGSLVLFVLALFSKETAVVLLPLLALPLAFGEKPFRRMLWLVPFAVLTVCSVAFVLSTRSSSFRYDSMSFSLDAPFWLTWPISLARLFWPWGVLAAIAILVWKPERYVSLLAIGLLWTGLSLIPYCFLTYAKHVPSRHTYLASAGVALIVGCAMRALAQKRARTSVAVVCGLMLVLNVGYLWTKKRAQFLERAAPTEQLVALVRKTNGPVFVQCFPKPSIVADAAVSLEAGRNDLIWDPAERHRAAATFCYGGR